MSSSSSQSPSPPRLVRNASSNSTATDTDACGIATPRQPIGANKGVFLTDFLKSINHSPPKKAEGVKTVDIVKTANTVLSPVQLPFENLSNAQKAKMAFLIVYDLHQVYLQMNKAIPMIQRKTKRAQDFRKALDEDSVWGRHLSAFVRKGGDEIRRGSGQKHYDAFLSAHKEWGQAKTIFNDASEPFVRFQRDESTVCFIIAAVNMILYYMRLKNPTVTDAAIFSYGINFNRFMRNNMTPKQIYEMVFRAGGGYPSHILENLLQPCKQTYSGKGKVGKLPFYGDSEPWLVAASVAGALRNTGPLLVDDFKTFPDFATRENTVFHGNWNKVKGPGESRRHAFLIVGVQQTEDGTMGGVKFLVQDSLEGRPFIEIGWDLLKSMDIFEFTFIREGVTYNPLLLSDSKFDGEEAPDFTLSGSPVLSFDRVPDTVVCAEDANIAALGSGDSEDPETPKIDWADMRLDIPEGADVNQLVVYS